MRLAVRTFLGGAVLLLMGAGPALAAQPSHHHHRGRGMMTVSESANGTTVTLRTNQRLDVLLHNTYWRFGPSSSSSVLASQGAQRFHPGGPGCPSIPGTGCGTTDQVFKAGSPGTAVISADRTTCGEALQCTPEQSHYRLTVKVVAG